jgi:ElaB/YqjD/DUF883 family membrane-anchored ribosome-binding protein
MDDSPGRLKRDPEDVIGSTGNTSGDAARDSELDERTSQIRSEIEETRVEMSETIDAIQNKLTPRNIVANATDRVKAAATERVRDMADTASQTAQQAMDFTRDAASGVTDRVRENPLPLALIGLGAAWLLARQNATPRRGSYGMRRGEREYEREYGTEPVRGEALYGVEREHGLMARIRQNPIPAALAGVGIGWLALSSESGRREYTTAWDEPPDEGRWAERTREYVSDKSASMRRMAQRRQSQLQHMVQDNPLLVGCGAMMLGVAFGMAVPETDTENQLMGEARDSVVGRARDMARDAASQVQDAAGSVADAAGRIAGKAQQ